MVPQLQNERESFGLQPLLLITFWPVVQPTAMVTYAAGLTTRLAALHHKVHDLCSAPVQSPIHVNGVEMNLAPFTYEPEGYGAECRRAKLDGAVHFVLESHVDGVKPTDDCPASQAAVYVCSCEMGRAIKTPLLHVAACRPPLCASIPEVPGRYDKARYG